jgi:hypothetical protein
LFDTNFYGILLMNYTYTLYGLTLTVPFPCPMLVQAPDTAVPDITVVEGPVPRTLDTPIVEDRIWQAAPGLFLLRGGPKGGRFLVENGQQITLQRNPAAVDERLCAHFLATVIVALMRQRGQLVLHANVVMTPRGAVAISGESGAGKSTAVAALVSRGCRMVTDDVTVLQLGDNGQLLVLPGIPKMNLCEDAAIKMGLDVECLPRNPLRKIKVFVPVEKDDMVTEPVQLKELYLLGRHSGKGLKITHLTGANKFSEQQKAIYGPLFPEEHPGMFSFISALAEQVETIRLERPIYGCSVSKVTEAILHG